MRRLTVLVLATVLLVGLAVPAYAGGRHHSGRHNSRHHNSSNAAVNVALGLASFAVFNQLVGGFRDPHWYHRTVVYEPFYVAPAPVFYQPAPVVYYTQPSVVYQPPQVVVAAPPPVIYPHGRYEFSGQQWVWIPNPPSPPVAEPCRYTGRIVRTPQGVLPECQ